MEKWTFWLGCKGLADHQADDLIFGRKITERPSMEQAPEYYTCQLPTDLLAAVLSRLPLQDRLQNCSTVCHAWRAAAFFSFSVISSQIKGASQCWALTSWLEQHSAAVHVLSLQGVYNDQVFSTGQHEFQLPLLPNLRSMSCICLDVSTTLVCRQPLPTHHSTRNTDCSTSSSDTSSYSDSDSGSYSDSDSGNGSASDSGSSSANEQDSNPVTQQQQELFAMAATAVPSPRPARVRVMKKSTALQQLALCSTAEPSCRRAAYAQQVHWGRLVQLTQLQLVEALQPGGVQAWELEDAYLKPIRHLTILKELELVSNDCTPAVLDVLPRSLTKLKLGGLELQLQEATCPGFARLTALQELDVSGFDDLVFDPAILADMVNLRVLNARGCMLLEDLWEDGPGFAAWSGLTALESVNLYGVLGADPVASLNPLDRCALTAPTGLTYLNLGCWALTYRQQTAMFEPGFTMPQLRSLELGPCHLSTPAAVSQLTACCSNLAALRVSSWPQVIYDPPAEPTDLPAVGPLRGLQALTALQDLAMDYVHLPASTLQELGSLRQLRSLLVTSATTSTACFAALMHLTSCKCLWELNLKLHFEHGASVEVAAHATQPPVIWIELPAIILRVALGTCQWLLPILDDPFEPPEYQQLANDLLDCAPDIFQAAHAFVRGQGSRDHDAHTVASSMQALSLAESSPACPEAAAGSSGQLPSGTADPNMQQLLTEQSKLVAALLDELEVALSALADLA